MEGPTAAAAALEGVATFKKCSAPRSDGGSGDVTGFSESGAAFGEG